LVTPEANVHIVIIMRERERETVNLVHTSERDRFVSANTRSPPALKRNQTTKGNPTNFLLFFKSNSLDELANIIWVFFFGKKTRKLTSRYVHFYSCCATINKWQVTPRSVISRCPAQHYIPTPPTFCPGILFFFFWGFSLLEKY
jgi:hypothetical protein